MSKNKVKGKSLISYSHCQLAVYKKSRTIFYHKINPRQFCEKCENCQFANGTHETFSWLKAFDFMAVDNSKICITKI